MRQDAGGVLHFKEPSVTVEGKGTAEELTKILEKHLSQFSEAKQDRILDRLEKSLALAVEAYNRHLEILSAEEKKAKLERFLKAAQDA